MGKALDEAVKPDLPKAARGLRYRFGSPFRYVHGSASRFRRASERTGIFYASETEATAIVCSLPGSRGGGQTTPGLTGWEVSPGRHLSSTF